MRWSTSNPCTATCSRRPGFGAVTHRRHSATWHVVGRAALPIRTAAGSDPRGRDARVTADSPPPRPPAALDDASNEWLRRLRAYGVEREQALAELHELLLRVAHAEARRRRGALPDAVVADLDDLCLQAADDALVSITAKLDDFAGRSRFTTWAIKFAIFEISTRLRRHAWRGRSVQLDDESWSRLPDARATTGQQRAEHRELLAELRRAVDQVLTPRQRHVFIAAAVQEVPIDVLAERLGSNRGAVYKTLHDARRKLRGALADAGMEVTA
jgi:RNA polymerase sigma-70 factor, ECF subfamily